MTVAVHIDAKDEYKAICANLFTEGKDKRLVKLADKFMLSGATEYWSTNPAIKKLYKAAGVPEYKVAKTEPVVVDG